MRSLTVSLLFMAGILVGILIKGGQQRKQTINVEGVSKFDEVMWYVGNDYVDVPDAQKLQDDAIAAMMDNLDPHSAYVSLEESVSSRAVLPRRWAYWAATELFTSTTPSQQA